MNVGELRARIVNTSAYPAVIGQGYVGLPVAALGTPVLMGWMGCECLG
jgi:UDP-N-acetyl-D-mannosaminuronate dehydrogenase